MRLRWTSASTLAILITLPTLAVAGPPLICHPFDIGAARSLPIGPADGGWSAIDRSYDRTRLVADTLALLTPTTPLLVRMETLRRATMYVTDDEVRARQLLDALHARARKAPTTPDDALALFDAGYLVETYRQLGVHTPALTRAIDGRDGYPLVATALRMTGDDPAMHFAAALITMHGAHEAKHAVHARAARAASADTLVAKNVRTHLRDS